MNIENVARQQPDYFRRFKKKAQMGSFFSDVTGINIDVNKAVGNLFQSIGNAISNINWGLVLQNVNIVVKAIATFAMESNPAHLTYMGLKTNPMTNHMFMELDHLTGHLLTSVDNAGSMPLRAARGDPISKAELIDNGLLVLKIVAIVASGGTAAAFIGAGSGQLSQGTLGETGTGKAILLVGGAVAGAAFTPVGAAGAAGSAAGSTATAVAAPTVTQVAVTASENVALSVAKTEVIKSSPLGQTALGQIAIGAGFAAGGAGIQGGDVLTGAASGVKSGVVGQAAKSVPYGGAAANFLIDNAGNLVSSSGGGGDSSSASPFSFDLTEIPGKIADAFSNISISLPSLGGGGGIDLSQISLPSFSAPDISLPEVNIGQIPNLNVGGILKKVTSKQKKVVNGKKVIHYVLADGTQVDVPDTSTVTSPQALQAGISPLILIGGLMLVMSLRKRD